MATQNDRTTDPNNDPSTATNSNAKKDPKDWVTGNEEMTGAQASYLKTLSEETHEAFDETLTKAEASEKISELREKSPRDLGTPQSKI